VYNFLRLVPTAVEATMVSYGDVLTIEYICMAIRKLYDLQLRGIVSEPSVFVPTSQSKIEPNHVHNSIK